MRHFLTIRDFKRNELLEIIELAIEIKKELHSTPIKYLEGKTLGMIFAKSSTRTRVSFEVGMYQLGGHALFLSSRDLQLGRGERMSDTARVISRMVDMIMIRTFSHSGIEEFAKYSKVPVINGLTDKYHPVQILADYMTMIEHGKGAKSNIAYVGDGNNIASSWLLFASKIGMDIRIATPKGYEVDADVVKYARECARISGSRILISNLPQEAVIFSDVVITDTWVSMGDEEEKEKRIADFEGFKVDSQLMAIAKKDALFMHCLPAYRGLEVTNGVLEGKQSVVFDEAENRLHAQKGVMVWLNNARKRHNLG